MGTRKLLFLTAKKQTSFGSWLISSSYWDKTSSGYYVSETLVDPNCSSEHIHTLGKRPANGTDLISVSLARSLLDTSQPRSRGERNGHLTAKIETHHFLKIKKGIVVQG